MEKSRFITAEEMVKDLCVSKAHAYKLIRKMNDCGKEVSSAEIIKGSSSLSMICGKSVSKSNFSP